MNKSELVIALQNSNPSLSRTDVSALLDSMAKIVGRALKTEGEMTIPGIVRLKTVVKPPTPEHPGVNPFTKQPIVVAAKPASTKIKAVAVKALKEAVA